MGRYGMKNELVWDLRENEEKRAIRARLLRAMYALVDPDGWDARRFRAAEQASAHTGTRVARHVSRRALASRAGRVHTGLHR